MARTCSTLGRGEKRVQKCGRKTSGKETNLEIYAKMEGYYRWMLKKWDEGEDWIQPVPNTDQGFSDQQNNY